MVEGQDTEAPALRIDGYIAKDRTGFHTPNPAVEDL